MKKIKNVLTMKDCKDDLYKFYLKKDKSKESYKHLLAKHLLANKLKEVELKNNDYCDFYGWSWRKNYGVFVELPFYKTSSVYYFENSKE